MLRRLRPRGSCAQYILQNMGIQNIDTNFPVIFMGVKLSTLHLRANIDGMQVMKVTLVIRGEEV